MEYDVVISVDIAVIGRTTLAFPRRGSFYGMVFENPVADVNDVNVLFDDDVAG